MVSPDNASTRTAISRESVAEDVKRMIAEYSNVAIDTITEATRPEEDLGWDSLDMVDAAMEFEDHFEIDVPEDFSEDIQTVGRIIDRLHELIVNAKDA